MAMLTRFFSGSVNPTFDRSSANPDVYAMQAHADMANTAAIDDAIQQQYVKLKQQQAAQDNLYTAQAKADMQLYMNNAATQLKSKAVPNGNLQQQAAQTFDNHALDLIKNAPSAAAQQHLLTVFPGLRAKAQINLNNYQGSLNQQATFDQFTKTVNSFANLATSNPDYADHIKQQVNTYGQAMSDAGYDAKAVMKAVNTAHNTIDMSVARQLMSTDPIGGMAKLDAGDYNHLKPNEVKTLRSAAASSLKAAQSAVSSDLNSIESRLFAGQPIPQDYEAIAQKAAGLGLHDQVNDLNKLLALNENVTGANATELKDLANSIEVGAKTGAINADPARVQKFLSFVNGNLKAMEKDGITYSETKGAFNPVTPITDFTNIDPRLAQERKYRALQAEEQLGVPTSALKQVEVSHLVDQIKGMGVNDRVKVLANINQFGNRTVNSVAEALDKTDPGLAAAAAVSLSSPDLARQVILGNEAIKAKLVTLPNEDEVASAALSVFGKNDLFGSDPLVKGRYLSAAKAIYAHDQSIGGSMSIEDALTKASNTISMDREGLLTGNYKTIAPAPDMSSSDFRGLLLNNLKSIDTWKKYGNGTPSSLGGDKPVNVEKTDPTNFQYIPSGGGKYMVVRDGRKVANEKGEPFLLDLSKLYRDNPNVSKLPSVFSAENLER